MDRRRAQYDGAALVGDAVADAGRGQHYVEELEKHIRARMKHSDAAIVFALRLLGPLRAGSLASGVVKSFCPPFGRMRKAPTRLRRGNGPMVPPRHETSRVPMR
jgi:hypothetical protein